MNRPLICVLGPTAVGKTDFVFTLSARYPLHLISVDAVQIYRGMDIGTAKPDQETLQRYPHALINILEPEENYSAARFCKDARREIEWAHKNQKIPVLVGGTMLYYLALFEGLADLPASTADSRKAIETRFAIDDGKTLYDELTQLDPASANKISPNDRQRIMRFSELILLTGKTPSQLFAAQKTNPSPWQILAIGFNTERAVLHHRIAQRFQWMMDNGFCTEVEALQKRPNLTIEHSSMRSVGYRQIWSYLAGEITLETAIENGIIATRQLAKRQITWMNNRLQNTLPLEIYDPQQEKMPDTVFHRTDTFLNNL